MSSRNILKSRSNYTDMMYSRKMDGIWRARVEDTKDPLGIGRVRIRIPKLHGVPPTSDSCSGTNCSGRTNYVKTENLPWCTPNFMSAGPGYGSYIVPEVGEYVNVGFEGGDTSRPVMLGSTYGTGSKKPKPMGSLDTTSGDYWEGPAGENECPCEGKEGGTCVKILYKGTSGRMFAMDKEKVYVKDKDGRSMELTEEGAVLQGKGGTCAISIKDDESVDIKANDTAVNIKTGEGVTINCGGSTIVVGEDGTVTIQAQTANINASTTNITSPTVNLTGFLNLVGDTNITLWDIL